MRKLLLLVAAGSLWLFLAAVPVLADGGPHVADINNGTTTLTTDSCAGCHRAHTAQGAYLLKVPEEVLCASCHGDEGTGATTDVWSGVQYAIGAGGARNEAVEIGALRAGGFEFTRIGDPIKKVGTPSGAKVTVAATAPAPVTSAHLPGIGGMTPTGIAWGNGANGTGAGPTASVTCGSCHNVHGNDQYRILKRVPEGTGVDPAWVVDVFDYNGTTGVYRTVSSHGLLLGDVVTVAGMTAGNATEVTVATVTSDTAFTLTGNPGGASNGTGGTVERVSDDGVANYGVKVTDNPPATAIAAGDARNYTVIQTPASAPTYYASEAAANYDPTDGDYLHYRVPWDGSGALNVDYNYDAPNGQIGTTVTVSGRTSVRTGDRAFAQEITAWCSSCHTRYYARSQPTTDPPNGTTGAAYNTARPDDNIFTFQHRTNGASGRGCLTCHVSHGSSVTMTGLAATVPLPGQTAGSTNSRMLKVDNRGTCQLCHDESEGTVPNGVYGPTGPTTDPGRP